MGSKRVRPADGVGGSGWRHLDVRVDRSGAVQILENMFLNPIGPRLARGDDFPDWPTQFPAGQLPQALAAAAQWDDWLEAQANRTFAKRKVSEESPRMPVHHEPDPTARPAPPPLPEKPPKKAKPAAPPAPPPSYDETPFGLFQ